MKIKGEEVKAAAYGSLYLDEGEGMPMVKKQVKFFAKNKPVRVSFDVLDKDGLVSEERVQYYVDATRAYIKEKLPYLAEEDISVSYSQAL